MTDVVKDSIGTCCGSWFVCLLGTNNLGSFLLPGWLVT